jgi:hypothetical protein
LVTLAGAAAFMSQLTRNRTGAATTASERRRRFEQWILNYQITESGLCRYYRYGPHAHEESPLATAYTILLLNESHPDVADLLVEGLVRLQEKFGSNRHAGGGVPSIANDESLLFYSSDALAATKAIMSVYKRSRDRTHLQAAAGFVEFVRRMADGETNGFLVRNVDFPMQYVTPAGVYQNWLVPNIGMLFWDALRDYAGAAADLSVARLFERGRVFLLNEAQAGNGTYYDHYDPGYPPRSYSPDRWRWFKTEEDGRRIGIGDNMMMSALGAQRMGDATGVERFLKWAVPQDGAFYAYIDVDTGGSGFHSSDRRYYDVVSSAMYYELCAKSGRLDAATRASLDRIFTLSAGADGGYRWGLRPHGGWVQDAAEALVTGYWIARAT